VQNQSQEGESATEMTDNSKNARVTAMDLKLLLNRSFTRSDWEAIVGDHLHLRIGNEPPAIGRHAALECLGTFLSRVSGFGCHYCDLWQRREAIYAETDIRFFRADGSAAEIPCSIVARVKDGLLQDIRFHLDPSPIP
jgi:hypothetical protein